MIDIMNDFIIYFGLDYTPTTFPELFQWLCCVIIGLCLVLSIIRAFFWLCATVSRGGRR